MRRYAVASILFIWAFNFWLHQLLTKLLPLQFTAFNMLGTAFWLTVMDIFYTVQQRNKFRRDRSGRHHGGPVGLEEGDD